MIMLGLYILVEPVPKYMAEQGMWLSKAYGQIRYMAKQGM
jgi:hypothetical protein